MKVNVLCILFMVCHWMALVEARSLNRTHEYILENGLKLIIREDHRTPIVVSQMSYKVGSCYEHNGITGLFLQTPG